MALSVRARVVSVMVPAGQGRGSRAELDFGGLASDRGEPALHSSLHVRCVPDGGGVGAVPASAPEIVWRAGVSRGCHHRMDA